VKDCNRETILYGHYRSIFNHCDITGLQSHRIRWKKTHNKGYYAVQGHSRSFKVIEVGANRKPVCDFLLVINSNWHPIPYRFGVIAAYCSHFGHCVFEPPLGGGLGTTYDVHIGLIGKRAVDFLLVLIELVSLSVTVEAISFQREPVDPNFQVEGVAPPPTILFSEK